MKTPKYFGALSMVLTLANPGKLVIIVSSTPDPKIELYARYVN